MQDKYITLSTSRTSIIWIIGLFNANGQMKGKRSWAHFSVLGGQVVDKSVECVTFIVAVLTTSVLTSGSQVHSSPYQFAAAKVAVLGAFLKSLNMELVLTMDSA